MRRVLPLVLAACILGLGSGVLRFAHEADHAHADACAEEAAGITGAHHGTHDHPLPGHHHHDESNCDLHALLNLPLAVTPAVVLLLQFGLFVAFLTLFATPLEQLRLPTRIDCRGPPPCWS